jgi:hypothetical protein
MGLPQGLHGVDLNLYFNKEYYQRTLPIWQDLDDVGTLGAAAGQTGIDPATRTALFNFLYGLLAGLILYLLIAKRQQAQQAIVKAFAKLKGSKGSKEND